SSRWIGRTGVRGRRDSGPGNRVPAGRRMARTPAPGFTIIPPREAADQVAVEPPSVAPAKPMRGRRFVVDGFPPRASLARETKPIGRTPRPDETNPTARWALWDEHSHGGTGRETNPTAVWGIGVERRGRPTEC